MVEQSALLAINQQQANACRQELYLLYLDHVFQQDARQAWHQGGPHHTHKLSKPTRGNLLIARCLACRLRQLWAGAAACMLGWLARCTSARMPLRQLLVLRTQEEALEHGSIHLCQLLHFLQRACHQCSRRAMQCT